MLALDQVYIEPNSDFTKCTQLVGFPINSYIFLKLPFARLFIIIKNCSNALIKTLELKCARKSL